MRKVQSLVYQKTAAPRRRLPPETARPRKSYRGREIKEIDSRIRRVYCLEPAILLVLLLRISGSESSTATGHFCGLRKMSCFTVWGAVLENAPLAVVRLS